MQVNLGGPFNHSCGFELTTERFDLKTNFSHFVIPMMCTFIFVLLGVIFFQSGFVMSEEYYTRGDVTSGGDCTIGDPCNFHDCLARANLASNDPVIILLGGYYSDLGIVDLNRSITIKGDGDVNEFRGDSHFLVNGTDKNISVILENIQVDSITNEKFFTCRMCGVVEFSAVTFENVEHMVLVELVSTKSVTFENITFFNVDDSSILVIGPEYVTFRLFEIRLCENLQIGIVSNRSDSLSIEHIEQAIRSVSITQGTVLGIIYDSESHCIFYGDQGDLCDLNRSGLFFIFGAEFVLLSENDFQSGVGPELTTEDVEFDRGYSLIYISHYGWVYVGSTNFLDCVNLELMHIHLTNSVFPVDEELWQIRILLSGLEVRDCEYSHSSLIIVKYSQFRYKFGFLMKDSVMYNNVARGEERDPTKFTGPIILFDNPTLDFSHESMDGKIAIYRCRFWDNTFYDFIPYEGDKRRDVKGVVGYTWLGENPPYLVFEECEFVRNRIGSIGFLDGGKLFIRGKGGVLYMSGVRGTLLAYVANSTFFGNFAAQGACIYGENVVLYMDSVEFNSSAGDFFLETGAIHLYRSDLILHKGRCYDSDVSCVFLLDSFCSVRLSRFVRGTSFFYGGGISVVGNSQLDETIPERTGKVILEDNLFVGNLALYGGGAVSIRFIEVNTDLPEIDLSGCFDENRALSGGALYLQNCKESLTKIRASHYGWENCDYETGLIFKENVAENYGGAAYLKNAILVRKGSLSLNSLLLTGNSANFAGGHIFTEGVLKKTMSDSFVPINSSSNEWICATSPDDVQLTDVESWEKGFPPWYPTYCYMNYTYVNQTETTFTVFPGSDTTSTGPFLGWGADFATPPLVGNIVSYNVMDDRVSVASIVRNLQTNHVPSRISVYSGEIFTTELEVLDAYGQVALNYKDAEVFVNDASVGTCCSLSTDSPSLSLDMNPYESNVSNVMTYPEIQIFISGFNETDIHCPNNTLSFGVRMKNSDFDSRIEMMEILIKIKPCPIGYRIENETPFDRIRCILCPLGSYSALENSKECHPCPPNADCIKRQGIAIPNEGYWGYVNQSKHMVMLYCPNGECLAGKVKSSGVLENQCDGNRDPSYPFCAHCNDGYSEWNGNCVECIFFTFWSFCVIVFFVFLFLLQVLATHKNSQDPESTIGRMYAFFCQTYEHTLRNIEWDQLKKAITPFVAVVASFQISVFSSQDEEDAVESTDDIKAPADVIRWMLFPLHKVLSYLFDCPYSRGSYWIIWSRQLNPLLFAGIIMFILWPVVHMNCCYFLCRGLCFLLVKLKVAHHSLRKKRRKDLQMMDVSLLAGEEEEEESGESYKKFTEYMKVTQIDEEEEKPKIELTTNVATPTQGLKNINNNDDDEEEEEGGEYVVDISEEEDEVKEVKEDEEEEEEEEEIGEEIDEDLTDSSMEDDEEEMRRVRTERRKGSTRGAVWVEGKLYPVKPERKPALPPLREPAQSIKVEIKSKEEDKERDDEDENQKKQPAKDDEDEGSREEKQEEESGKDDGDDDDEEEDVDSDDFVDWVMYHWWKEIEMRKDTPWIVKKLCGYDGCCCITCWLFPCLKKIMKLLSSEKKEEEKPTSAVSTLTKIRKKLGIPEWTEPWYIEIIPFLGCVCWGIPSIVCLKIIKTVLEWLSVYVESGAYVLTLLNMSMMTYQLILENSLSFVICKEINGIHYMVEYSDIHCYTVEYWSQFPFIFAIPILYCSIFPFAIFLFLFVNKRNLYKKNKGGKSFSDQFGILYVCYRPNAWWYECFQIFRKLVIVSLISFSSVVPVHTDYFLSIFLWGQLLLHLCVRPYHRLFDNVLEGVILFSLSVLQSIRASLLFNEDYITSLVLIVLTFTPVFITLSYLNFRSTFLFLLKHLERVVVRKCCVTFFLCCFPCAFCWWWLCFFSNDRLRELEGEDDDDERSPLLRSSGNDDESEVQDEDEDASSATASGQRKIDSIFKDEGGKKKTGSFSKTFSGKGSIFTSIFGGEKEEGKKRVRKEMKELQKPLLHGEKEKKEEGEKKKKGF